MIVKWLAALRPLQLQIQWTCIFGQLSSIAHGDEYAGNSGVKIRMTSVWEGSYTIVIGKEAIEYLTQSKVSSNDELYIYKIWAALSKKAFATSPLPKICAASDGIKNSSFLFVGNLITEETNLESWTRSSTKTLIVGRYLMLLWKLWLERQ